MGDAGRSDRGAGSEGLTLEPDAFINIVTSHGASQAETYYYWDEC